ncbi:MAG: hypothetical protein AAF799_28695 [Myxococcota bacterium]
MGLRDWLRRKPEPKARPIRLRSAEDCVQRYRSAGADDKAAIEGARRQIAGLRHEIADDARWARLVTMARQIGDPWNADDWPSGFDGLLCAITLCTHVSFECARCPVGRRQDGRSCAHPNTAFGRIGDLVRRDDRSGLRSQLDSIEAILDDAE